MPERDQKNSALASNVMPDGWLENPARALLELARRGLKLATFVYLIVLCLVLGGLEWWGERNWFLSFCLYLPPLGWLLPLLVLAPLAGLFRPILLLLHALCAVLVLVFFMDFQWALQPAARGPTLTLVTNNYGENARTTPLPFFRAEQADLLALQDLGYRGRLLATNFPDFFLASKDQFTLISRWPIKDYDIVPVFTPENRAVAVRFEVDCDGRRVVVYNIHLPTPRKQLESMLGLGLVAAAAGREGHHGGKLREQNYNFWTTQLDLAHQLAARIRQEKLPCLAVGDFNVPNHGCIHRLFSGLLTDSFKVRGRGFGFTLPGVTHNPFSLFRPWLRLDCIFASQELKPLYSRTESDRPSQHRAVVARFELPPVK